MYLLLSQHTHWAIKKRTHTHTQQMRLTDWLTFVFILKTIFAVSFSFVTVCRRCVPHFNCFVHTYFARARLDVESRSRMWLVGPLFIICNGIGLGRNILLFVCYLMVACTHNHTHRKTERNINSSHINVIFEIIFFFLFFISFFHFGTKSAVFRRQP